MKKLTRPAPKNRRVPRGVFRLSQAGESLFGSNIALQHLLRFLFLLLPRQCFGYCLSTCSSCIFSTCSCLLLSVPAEAASPCSLVSSAFHICCCYRFFTFSCSLSTLLPLLLPSSGLCFILFLLLASPALVSCLLIPPLAAATFCYLLLPHSALCSLLLPSPASAPSSSLLLSHPAAPPFP